MLIKFANAEVEIWKLRQGVVVMKGSDACHIVSIGTVWQRLDDTVVNIQTKSMSDRYPTGPSHFSTDLTWVEPF